jgi:hypothetical protein
LVIARQGSDLDLDLVTLSACLALALKPGLMRRISDRQPAGEHPPMPTGELAGVQNNRGDLGLGDANLNAAPSELRVD